MSDQVRAYAGIGSRKTPDNVIHVMEDMGEALAKLGFILKTGNAQGADQAFARGANRVDPHLIWLYLPWKGYEKEAIVEGNRVLYPSQEDVDEAVKRHPAGENLTYGVRKLMGRNLGIISQIEKVYAYQIPELTRGGTWFGINYAVEFGIPVVNLALEEELERVQQILRAQ